MERIKEAIFVYGPGRSGTTLLYNILSLHPDLAWISGYVNRFPRLPALSALNRIQYNHTIERLNRGKRKWPRPSEAYNFWYHYFPSFSMPKTQKERNLEDRLSQCVETINAILVWSGKKRFITKLTGDHDLTKLNEIFVDPKIIYINRDPRAVTMSYLRRRWTFHGKVGPLEAADIKELIKQYVQRYLQIYSSNMIFLPKMNSIHVKYEDLIKNPENFFHCVLGLVDLDFSSQFRRTLKSWEFIDNTNQQWRKELDTENIQYLESLLFEICNELGYS
jgi:hypothetical protein